MQNNMELGYEMFCYQCEQTANGKGCTRQGVCGKTPEVANLQDLLIFQLKGISCYGKILLDQGEKLDKGVISFIENCLFTTLTNVNFDSEVHVKLLKEAQKIKDELRQLPEDSKHVEKIRSEELQRKTSICLIVCHRKKVKCCAPQRLPESCMIRIWMKISVLCAN